MRVHSGSKNHVFCSNDYISNDLSSVTRLIAIMNTYKYMFLRISNFHKSVTNSLLADKRMIFQDGRQLWPLIVASKIVSVLVWVLFWKNKYCYEFAKTKHFWSLMYLFTTNSDVNSTHLAMHCFPEKNSKCPRKWDISPIMHFHNSASICHIFTISTSVINVLGVVKLNKIANWTVCTWIKSPNLRLLLNMDVNRS